MPVAGAVELSTFDLALAVLASALSALALPARVVAFVILWRRRRAQGRHMTSSPAARTVLIASLVVLGVCALLLALAQSGVLFDI